MHQKKIHLPPHLCPGGVGDSLQRQVQSSVSPQLRPAAAAANERSECQTLFSNWNNKREASWGDTSQQQSPHGEKKAGKDSLCIFQFGYVVLPSQSTNMSDANSAIQ